MARAFILKALRQFFFILVIEFNGNSLVFFELKHFRCYLIPRVTVCEPAILIVWINYFQEKEMGIQMSFGKACYWESHFYDCWFNLGYVNCLLKNVFFTKCALRSFKMQISSSSPKSTYEAFYAFALRLFYSEYIFAIARSVHNTLKSLFSFL